MIKSQSRKPRRNLYDRQVAEVGPALGALGFELYRSSLTGEHALIAPPTPYLGLLAK